ncbi:S1C family serine protease [Alkalicoccobacillus porphyridii]|uniref:Trypsin-like peptidase domain-containing protein n=1 Tax=Alkalicoccobacillus porphyridii TaxID=2597270 RepID=A0A554A0E3_9BACI|nr:S1C family serine protease [Alkalicoccobacillus porphyridii]TSB47158.1 trypsin-like peptidase domain-containing protein [Alkalicoccobacillus porphyridii]
MSDHDSKQDDRLPEERMEGEPEPEDFLPDASPKSKKSKWWVKLGAILVSVILIGNAGAFLLQHYGQDARQLVSESEELSDNEQLEVYKSTVVTIQRGQSRGTGFFFDASGLLLTNHHVADGEGPLIVTTSEGEKYQGEIEKEDEELDLAKIKIESDSEHPFLPLSQSSASGNQLVYIIGNPLTHNQISIQGSIIDSDQLYDAIQIEASIFQGHSGSPVISEEGEVLGVVYAKTIPGFMSEEDSVGLAVPINRVHEFLEED